MGYDRLDNPPFLYRGTSDDRLLPKERVVAVIIDGVAAALPHRVLRQRRVVDFEVGGRRLIALFKPGTRSALNELVIAQSADAGATGVFADEFEGQALSLRPHGAHFVDAQTGSVWSILGEAVDGPARGGRLTPVVHADPFWFSWAALRPDTSIYPG